MFSKMYLDTAPIIYFLENHPFYALKVQNVFLDNMSAGCSFATSVVTNIEYLPKPLQENKKDLVSSYNSLRKLLNIEYVPADEKTSMIAVNFRTKYPSLKALDSIHLATAIYSGCDVFFTNDKQLKQVKEIKILYLEDL